MAYADRHNVPRRRQRYLGDAGLMHKQRRLADEQEGLGNRILCKLIDPDEYLLSSRDACRKEILANCCALSAPFVSCAS